MKNTRILLALLIAMVMVFSAVPAFGGSGERALSSAERAEKAEQLEVFAGELAEVTSVYDTDLESRANEGEFALARLIVKYNGELPSLNALAHVQGYNDWHILQFASPAEAEEAMKQYKLMKGVVWVEPDEIMSVCATPGNSNFNSWGYGADQINAYEYNQWLYAQYGSNLANLPEIVVAVVDTGADLDHPYLVARLIQGYNVVNGSNIPEDGHSHGTHVSGTVVDGTFSNVKIMPIKVLSDSGSGSTAQVCLGMEYGYLHGADVENLSLGGGCDGGAEHYMMAEVIDMAYDNGCTVCVAAGNDTMDAAGFCPANVERACTVAATTQNKTLCYFSNFGAVVDIAAPGDNIYSSTPGGSYGYKSGTSMACPHVAAVAAQIKSFNPSLSADEVVSVIKGAALNINVTNAGSGLAHLAANLFTLDPAANAPGQYIHFFSSGSYAWTVDGNSVVSGNAGVNSSTSALTARVSVGFEQVLSFDYKVSSETNDVLRLKANGSVIFQTSGEQEWQTATVTIPGKGSVELVWEYAKNASASSGSDKAWLRNVSILPSLSSAANLSGGDLLFESSGTYPWVADSVENAAMSGNAGVNNSTSVMTVEHQLKKLQIVVFKYYVSAASGELFTLKDNGRPILTAGPTEGYVDFEYTVPTSGTHTFTFEFKKDSSGSAGRDCVFVKCYFAYHSFESAINGTDDYLPFFNEGEYPWCAYYDYVGSTNWSQDSSDSNFNLTLTMTRGETLSFRYRSSSETNYDYLRFYVDGEQQFQQSGDHSEWTQFTFTAPANRVYVFKWAFEKDYSAAYYDDAGYIDDVVYSGSYVQADGDANCDGVVDSLDALLVLRYSMGLI
ncbi:MAG: S8 family serine peptidase, partial [Clostridia bacterium]|nr:S8 family serine peptidase [Clostridia bacterium]